MDKTTLKQLKPGTLFRLKDSESSPVWVRDHYDRSSKTYACHKYEDYNHEAFFKGTRTQYSLILHIRHYEHQKPIQQIS